MWGWSPSGPCPTAAFKGASTGSNEVLSQDVLDDSWDVTVDLFALMRIKVHWGSSSQDVLVPKNWATFKRDTDTEM